MPRAVSSSASFAVDFVVHRNGDFGSPRVSGSTSASSAGQQLRVGHRLARAPRTRAADPPVRPAALQLAHPAPPCPGAHPRPRPPSDPTRPSSRASAPSSNRRARSSRCGRISANRAAIGSDSTPASVIPQH